MYRAFRNFVRSIVPFHPRQILLVLGSQKKFEAIRGIFVKAGNVWPLISRYLDIAAGEAFK